VKRRRHDVVGESGRETLCLSRFKRYISDQKHENTFPSIVQDVRKSIAFFEGSLSSPACPSDKSRVEIQMNVEHWWNDADRGKLKYWERNLSQCHFVHHKSYMD
jgi:hypothetical protein